MSSLSLQVVTWAEGWRAINTLKVAPKCVVVLRYLEENLESVDLFSYVLARTSRSISDCHREGDRQFYTLGLSKQPSSLHPHPSSRDHVSREGHRFPQVGKSLL
jgi:hypothetical protein